MTTTSRPTRVPSMMMRTLYARTTSTVTLWDDYGASWTEQRAEFPETRDDSKAVLVSSLLADGRHAPALDVDHAVAVLPSSTPGHHHLYIDVAMPWWRYRVLLWALRLSGVIEPGYYQASIRRRATHLRHPRVSKVDLP